VLTDILSWPCNVLMICAATPDSGTLLLGGSAQKHPQQHVLHSTNLQLRGTPTHSTSRGTHFL
jgi:hypothetical protein